MKKSTAHYFKEILIAISNGLEIVDGMDDKDERVKWLRSGFHYLVDHVNEMRREIEKESEK